MQQKKPVAPLQMQQKGVRDYDKLWSLNSLFGYEFDLYITCYYVIVVRKLYQCVCLKYIKSFISVCPFHVM